jgi:UDP:flavonoid glycosyltransferase YjiC (YdhE family)
MRFLLSTIGTMGDAMPFIEIASALRRRGHEATLLASAYFRESAESNGVRFHPLGTAEEYLRLANDKDLYHPLRGVKKIAERWALPAMRGTLEYLMANRPSGDTVLVGAPVTVGLRTAQELFKLPLHTLILSPFMLPSLHLAPVAPGLSLPQWAPRGVKRAFQAMTDHGLDGIFKPSINSTRAEHGLPPITASVRSWWLSSTSVIGLFPDWYAPVQPDWPSSVTLAGFLPPPSVPEGLPEEVRVLVEEEEGRLAVVTMGSILTGNEATVRLVVEECLAGGFKVLLLAASPKIQPVEWSPKFRQLPFAPLAPVLARASVLLHHAGIGTAAAAIAAGVPQLLMPHGHDQFDNAARLTRMGVARVVRPGRLMIDKFLADEQVAAACRRCGKLFDAAPGIEGLCRLLESRDAFA